MIQETFTSLVNRYRGDHQQTENLWNEIVKNYSGRGRHYHTLEHLNHILTQILPCENRIRDLDAVLFALFYHDIVYNVLKKDNEEKSAAYAVKILSSLSVPKERIETCKKHILATKTHVQQDDSDTNIFTDADLSILGQEWDAYNTYCLQIRKEYSIYPDLVYNPGRKKVLQHFLQMERIFKTQFFYDKYENQSRRNLERELNQL